MKGNWRKKALVIAGLVVVGSGLIVGISWRLKSPEPVNIQEAIIQEDEMEVVVNPEKSDMVKEQAAQEVETSGNKDLADIPDTVTDTEPKQYIQEEPVKTEDEKPSEPPEEVVEATEKKQEESENTKPAEKKITAEKNTSTTQTSSSKSPKTGDTKDGKIYIEGFGWVDDEGGGTSGTKADDMYENGNKIGIMD